MTTGWPKIVSRHQTLVLVLLGCLVVAACAGSVGRPATEPVPPSSSTSTGSIDEPYIYPSLSPELRADPPSAMAALQVPQEILASMTTPAVVETVLGHPYSMNLLAYSSPRQAVEQFSQSCNALLELLHREDIDEALARVLKAVDTGDLEISGLSADMTRRLLGVLVNRESDRPYA